MSTGPSLPEGFQYRDDFITGAEERELIESLSAIEFENFEMRGVIARRRVAFYGSAYDSSVAVRAGIPDFLLSLRQRIAAWAGVAPEQFAMALINEYREGSPIGWHRDAPQYDLIAGVSLLSPARMKFRPYVAPSAQKNAADKTPRKATHELTLLPRSAYLIAGRARSHFEHHIPPTEALRYSITFRTLR